MNAAPCKRNLPSWAGAARSALCRVPAAEPWLWLVRSGAVETVPAASLVLLDALPRLLGAFGAGAAGHG